MSSFETYGLSTDEFKGLFRQKAELAFELFYLYLDVAGEKGFNTREMDPKLMQSLFDDICYATTDEARTIQRQKDPEGFMKSDPFDVGVPSLQQLLDAFGELKGTIEAKLKG